MASCNETTIEVFVGGGYFDGYICDVKFDENL